MKVIFVWTKDLGDKIVTWIMFRGVWSNFGPKTKNI